MSGAPIPPRLARTRTMHADGPVDPCWSYAMAESSTQELGRTAAPPHIGIGIAVTVVALAVSMLVGSPVAALGVGCVIGLALD